MIKIRNFHITLSGIERKSLDPFNPPKNIFIYANSLALFFSLLLSLILFYTLFHNGHCYCAFVVTVTRHWRRCFSMFKHFTLNYVIYKKRREMWKRWIEINFFTFPQITFAMDIFIQSKAYFFPNSFSLSLSLTCCCYHHFILLLANANRLRSFSAY